MAETKAELLDPSSVYSLLVKMKGELEAALPRHITPDRMTRVALTSLRMNPKLFRSTKESFFGALLTGAAIGLEPGVLGRAWLVPYYNKKLGETICQLIPGWRGHLDLVSRAGKAAAWTGAVYDGDEFDWGLGDRPFVRQREGKWHGEARALMYTYACGRQNGIDWPNVEVWPIEKIWAHRDKYNKVGSDHYSYRDPEMYARKIPLLQVIKYLPASIEMIAAQTLDIMGSQGQQRLTIDMALKGDLGDSQLEDAEVEQIMEALEWPEADREKFREAYDGRPKAALEYLKPLRDKRGQQATASAGTNKPKTENKTEPKTEKKDPEKTEKKDPEPKDQRPDLGNGEGTQPKQQPKQQQQPNWWTGDDK